LLVLLLVASRVNTSRVFAARVVIRIVYEFSVVGSEYCQSIVDDLVGWAAMLMAGGFIDTARLRMG
jgi:hypothetical protein